MYTSTQPRQSKACFEEFWKVAYILSGGGRFRVEAGLCQVRTGLNTMRRPGMTSSSSPSHLSQLKLGRLSIVALMAMILLMSLGFSAHHNSAPRTPGFHTLLRCADLTAGDQDFGAAGFALVYDVSPRISIAPPSGKAFLVHPLEAKKNHPAQTSLPPQLRAPPVVQG